MEEFINEAEYWKKIETFFEENFTDGETPNLEAILFLIGVQELGKGKANFKKDEKVNLIHIAVCRLLEPFGYYEFERFDEDGWPHYRCVELLPDLKANEQQLLMKKAIIHYFLEEGLI